MPDMPIQLVCRPRPYVDESLLSYLLRIQLANGYKHLSWLTGYLRDISNIPVPNRLNTGHSVPFLEHLAQATTMPVLDLYEMTLNHYASMLTLPETTLVWIDLSSGEKVSVCQNTKSIGHCSRPDRTSAFCPKCLRDAPYHRLPWLLHPIFACTQHHNWLNDTCASCDEPVSVQSIVNGQCEHCAAILMNMPTIPLDATSESVQLNLMDCLKPHSILPDSYPPLSSRALFRLLDGLCSLIRAAGWTWEACYHPHGIPQELFPPNSNCTMSTTQHGTLYVSAWHVLRDWPVNFYTFIDRYRQRPEAGHGGIRQLLGHFYGVWLEHYWRHPDMEPVQAAFNDYLVKHFPASRQIRHLNRLQRYPELQDRFRFIDVRNAARSLGVSPPMIKRLVRDAYVRVYPQRDPSHPGYFVYRSDLEDVLQRKPERVKFKDLALEFSVGLNIIADWIQGGLLHPSGARQLHGISQPFLTRPDVDAFRQQLADCVHLQAEKPADTLSLKTSCIRNGKVGMNSTQLLQRVLDGKLRAYHTHPKLDPFSELWFDSQDVMTLTEQVKTENNWMGFLEVRRLLEVSRDVVHLWIERKFLIPVATFARAVYFDRKTVLDFHARLIRSHELARWLETSRSAISIWVRAGYLPVLSGMGRGQGKSYIFDRDVIADWHTQYVTAGELQRVLGSIYYKVFLKRVRLGIYAAAEDVKQRFYHRTDLEQFQKELEQ